MNHLLYWFNRITKKHRELRRWQRIVTVLAAVVTFATTYALILPAITVEKNRTEEVAGMYLERSADGNAMLEENAPEPTEIDASDVQEGEETASSNSDAADGEEITAAPEVRTLRSVGSDYTVTLTYDETSGIPSDADLYVSEIAQDSEEYETYLEEAKKAMGLAEEEALPRFAARFFDIKIMVGDQEFVPESGVSVEITYAEPMAENPETEVSAVHFADEAAEAEVIEVSTTNVQDDGAATVEFTAESFSVYGVIYTVDFHWEVDGKMYEFSIPGGGFASFYKIVEVLGISELGTQSDSGDENAAENSEIEAGNGENTADSDVFNGVEETGVDDNGANGSNYEESINLNNVEVSEETKQFVADVASVEFSSPELVWVGKVEEKATVGQLKSENGLEVQYSADLTEEQIGEINGGTVEDGDWALISMRPFTSEETLTVTMKTGEVFTIKVTDAQISKRILTADGKTYEITVTYGEDAQIPAGAELRVEEITKEDNRYAGYYEKTLEMVDPVQDEEDSSEKSSEDESVTDLLKDAVDGLIETVTGADTDTDNKANENYARIFDIQIWNGEERIEPQAEVRVDIRLLDAPEDDELSPKVVHFAEAGPEVMEISEAAEESDDEPITFITDEFSVY